MEAGQQGCCPIFNAHLVAALKAIEKHPAQTKPYANPYTNPYTNLYNKAKAALFANARCSLAFRLPLSIV